MFRWRLGTLNMGLVNVAMPMIVIGLYLIAMKDVKHILKLKIGWGILIYLAIVAPWYVAVSLKGGYAQNLIIVTNFTRYFKEFAHARPFYYYLTTTPPYFLPWLIFLPGAFYLCFSQQTKMERKQLLFPFLWVVGLFVFFSISKTKRSEYLLPIYPAMALLVGYVIDRSLRRWDDSLFWRRLISWPIAHHDRVFGDCRDWNRHLRCNPLNGMAVYYPADFYRPYLGRSAGLLPLCPRPTHDVHIDDCRDPARVGGLRGWAGRFKEEPGQIGQALLLSWSGATCRPAENLKMYDFVRPIYGVYTERFMDVTRQYQKADKVVRFEETRIRRHI